MSENTNLNNSGRELQAPVAGESPTTGRSGKLKRTLTLSWRDENYGFIRNALAFRFSCDPALSDTAATKLVRMFHRNGFTFNHHRDSWIGEACSVAEADRLTGDLQAAGYEIVHAGCVPPSLTSTQNSPR